MQIKTTLRYFLSQTQKFGNILLMRLSGDRHFSTCWLYYKVKFVGWRNLISLKTWGAFTLCLSGALKPAHRSHLCTCVHLFPVPCLMTSHCLRLTLVEVFTPWESVDTTVRVFFWGRVGGWTFTSTPLQLGIYPPVISVYVCNDIALKLLLEYHLW